MKIDFDENDKQLLDPKELTNFKLFVATPCYGGMLYQEYANSLLSTLFQFLVNGVGLEVYLAGNESLIPRGRNHIVSEFMAGDSTHLLFIDADIQFHPKDVFKLLQADRHVTCGAYPLKKYPIEYVVNFPENALTNSKTKLVEIDDAGTGFMMIKRETIQAMQKSYPELHYTSDIDGGYRGEIKDQIKLNLLKENLYSLFDTCHDVDNDNAYLSEDYTFCRRWQKMGGKVWLDPSIELNHIGKNVYQGDVSKIIDFDKGVIND